MYWLVATVTMVTGCCGIVQTGDTDSPVDLVLRLLIKTALLIKIVWWIEGIWFFLFQEKELTMSITMENEKLLVERRKLLQQLNEEEHNKKDSHLTASLSKCRYWTYTGNTERQNKTELSHKVQQTAAHVANMCVCVFWSQGWIFSRWKTRNSETKYSTCPNSSLSWSAACKTCSHSTLLRHQAQ